MHFNTSHVSINLQGQAVFQPRLADFNTSHVSINPIRLLRSLRLRHFNTSHVSINRNRHRSGTRTCQISIHPMFLLISIKDIAMRAGMDNFNTSHVSINPGAVAEAYDRFTEFQYIPCFY